MCDDNTSSSDSSDVEEDSSFSTFSNIRNQQDQNYKQSLKKDRLKNNHNIIRALETYCSVKEEKDRLRKIEMLNNMSPKNKRLLILGKILGNT